MHPLFHIPSTTLLTGLALLSQAPFHQASGSAPSVPAQEKQTFILPCYLKSGPLSEKSRSSGNRFPLFLLPEKIREYICSSGNTRNSLLTKAWLFSFSVQPWARLPVTFVPGSMN